MLHAYDELLQLCRQCDGPLGQKVEAVIRLRGEVDIDFIVSDVDNLLAESIEGARRVQEIVSDLRDFSHVDSPDLT